MGPWEGTGILQETHLGLWNRQLPGVKVCGQDREELCGLWGFYGKETPGVRIYRSNEPFMGWTFECSSASTNCSLPRLYIHS